MENKDVGIEVLINNFIQSKKKNCLLIHGSAGNKFIDYLFSFHFKIISSIKIL